MLLAGISLGPQLVIQLAYVASCVTNCATSCGTTLILLIGIGTTLSIVECVMAMLLHNPKKEQKPKMNLKNS